LLPAVAAIDESLNSLFGEGISFRLSEGSLMREADRTAFDPGVKHFVEPALASSPMSLELTLLARPCQCSWNA
jgi:hypothetical protein